MLDYFLLRRAIKQALHETQVQVYVAQQKAGILKDIIVRVNADASPPSNKQWSFQCGMIHHVTGIDTSFQCREAKNNLYYFVNNIVAAEPTGGKPLDLFSSQVVVKEKDYIRLTGGSVIGALIRVIESNIE